MAQLGRFDRESPYREDPHSLIRHPGSERSTEGSPIVLFGAKSTAARSHRQVPSATVIGGEGSGREGERPDEDRAYSGDGWGDLGKPLGPLVGVGGEMGGATLAWAMIPANEEAEP